MSYLTIESMLKWVVAKKELCNLFFIFCFVGCYTEPGKKKQFHSVKTVINKSVTSRYNPSVDVLFIIDDSMSMKAVQHLLAVNAEVFIDKFLDVAFVDYRIAVTTSTVGFHSDGNSVAPDGKLHFCGELAKRNNYYSNYIDRKMPDLVECFREMIRVGVGGSLNEKFLVIPDLVFSPNSKFSKENMGFYRSGAHLAVFAITDTDDNDDGITPEEAYKFLLRLKKNNKKKLHYALGFPVIEISQYSCERESYIKIPTKMMKMVELFGPRGYLFNLCQFNYGKSLAEFASELVNSVLTLPLDYLPDMDTLEVRYHYKEGSQLIPNGLEGWIYNVENNTIYLSKDVQLSYPEGSFSIKYEPLYTSEFIFKTSSLEIPRVKRQ